MSNTLESTKHNTQAAAGQPEQLTSKDRLPGGSYVVRCTNVDFSFSKSSGNPMFVTEWELIGYRVTDPTTKKMVCQPTVNVLGINKAIGGTKVRPVYFTLTEKAKERWFDICRQAGLPTTIDLDNPLEVGKQLIGKAFNAQVKSTEYVRRNELTQEQKEAGIKPEEADAILDEDGNEIKGYNNEISNFIDASRMQLPSLSGAF